MTDIILVWTLISWNWTLRTAFTRFALVGGIPKYWEFVEAKASPIGLAYSKAEKTKLLHDHASTVFEDFCCRQHPDASRYWERDVEFDFVRLERSGKESERAVVSEVKWKMLSASERSQVGQHLSNAWSRCTLRRRFTDVQFEILDATILKNLEQRV